MVWDFPLIGVKKDLQELDLDYVNEIREYLERMVKSTKLMKEIDNFRNKLEKKTGVTVSSADLIHKDREHGH